MSIIENNKSEVLESETPDDLLLELARIGDRSAYGVLWERHQRSLCAAVRPLAHANTEDVVSETFVQIWDQLQNKRGPIDNFRAYAITVARNISARWYKYGRAIQDANVYPIAESPASEIAEVLEDQREISTAFANLPRSWQMALWRVEVNDEPRAEVASSMQISTNALSQLLRRAKEGLREAWLVQHLPRIVAHAEYTSALPKYVRGTLPAAKRKLLKKHLHDCDDCMAVYLTLVENNRKLAVATVGAMALTGAGTIAALTVPGATPASAAVIVLGKGAVVAGATGGFAFLGAIGTQIQEFIKANQIAAIGIGTAAVAGVSFFAMPQIFATTDTSVASKTAEHAAGSSTPHTNHQETSASPAAASSPADTAPTAGAPLDTPIETSIPTAEPAASIFAPTHNQPVSTPSAPSAPTPVPEAKSAAQNSPIVAPQAENPAPVVTPAAHVPAFSTPASEPVVPTPVQRAEINPTPRVIAAPEKTTPSNVVPSDSAPGNAKVTTAPKNAAPKNAGQETHSNPTTQTTQQKPTNLVNPTPVVISTAPSTLQKTTSEQAVSPSVTSKQLPNNTQQTPAQLAPATAPKSGKDPLESVFHSNPEPSQSVPTLKSKDPAKQNSQLPNSSNSKLSNPDSDAIGITVPKDLMQQRRNITDPTGSSSPNLTAPGDASQPATPENANGEEKPQNSNDTSAETPAEKLASQISNIVKNNTLLSQNKVFLGPNRG